MIRAIAPSVLGLPHASMRQGVEQLIAGGASMLHFDVMDGQFVPPITFGDALVRSLRDIPGIFFEAHLMIETPDRQFEAFRDAGCQRVTFHAEVTPHAHRLVQRLHDLGLQAGVAINPGTPPEFVEPLLGSVDLVLVMTVNPGWGGQRFIDTCLEKVRRIRSWASDLDIEVDGGVDPETMSMAAEAGANVFVVGNYLTSKPHLAQTMQELNALCV